MNNQVGYQPPATDEIKKPVIEPIPGMAPAPIAPTIPAPEGQVAVNPAEQNLSQQELPQTDPDATMPVSAQVAPEPAPQVAAGQEIPLNDPPNSSDEITTDEIRKAEKVIDSGDGNMADLAARVAEMQTPEITG